MMHGQQSIKFMALFLRFLGHSQRHTTVGRTPLDDWSVRRMDFYLTKHNTHKRQTSMQTAGFDLPISAGERPQTYAVDRAANVTAECTTLKYIAILYILLVIVLWRCSPTRSMASSFMTFLDHKQRTTGGRTPLDEWSARRRDLYLTTHHTHNRQISMPPVGFEPIIPASGRPQIHALDRAATGKGNVFG
jgi:hypothetical protein